MPKVAEEKGESIEVLGTCMTNTRAGSQHEAKVEYRHLWSYAQQAALIAVSDKSDADGCYHLITDPERRAKRIAAHYANLYFESAKKSNGKMQFYWPALAAFVVKDIVEAYRFAREDVMHREWKNLASAIRNSPMADMSSAAMTKDSPYQHAIRTYSALAKGNLWLFMDIYPWLWFFLEYGINADGTLNNNCLHACLPERKWETFQRASKEATEELPYGPNWMARLAVRLKEDVVYKKATSLFNVPPRWSSDDGYGAYMASTYAAHSHCRTQARTYDNGYRIPPGGYWMKFKQAYYVMGCEHVELNRMTKDSEALKVVEKLRSFAVTPAVSATYQYLIDEYAAASNPARKELQLQELVAIAQQEQINVLQPLIYNDPFLTETMDVNHRFSRLTNGWLSPQFKVVYSASPVTDDPSLETVFDEPKTSAERFFGKIKSLPRAPDRMEFVEQIAADFDRLMKKKGNYMDDELKKITRWLSA